MPLDMVIICLYFNEHIASGARWQSGTVRDFAIARSRVRLLPVATVHQRLLSVPSLRGLLMSTSESWGSKRAYHAMHYPRIRGLAASAGVRRRATENGDQRRPMGP